MTEGVSTSAFMGDLDISTTEYAAYTTIEDVQTTESIYNASSVEHLSSSPHHQDNFAVLEAFNIMELIMTSLEMMVWIVAALKMPRWRRNYRNQMLMQISVARFIKRLIFSVMFLEDYKIISCSNLLNAILDSSQIYIDFVIVILVFFFIKHMYDSLIIVLVKVRQNSLYKVSMCSWLVPIPISAVWTAIIILKALDKWVVYLLICCIFRWPLIFLGTAVYITILHRVLSEKIRRFAGSLTIVTFWMCLMINVYLLSKDLMILFGLESFVLVSYVSGLIMNLLILSFYIILITLDYKHCYHSPKALNPVPNYSLGDTCKI